jgi:Cu(I)/Ag(I) efflux system protein CusF
MTKGEIMKTLRLLVLAAALVASPSLVTATSHDVSTPMTNGEVRKVDRDAKKLTIRHGPIESLGMPPMTMVFQVKDPAMLDQVKTGDKVRFAADKVGGAYTVTKIEPVK